MKLKFLAAGLAAVVICALAVPANAGPVEEFVFCKFLTGGKSLTPQSAPGCFPKKVVAAPAAPKAAPPPAKKKAVAVKKKQPVPAKKPGTGVTPPKKS